MAKDKNYRKMYYETLIELLELKIKDGIDIDENLNILKKAIVESFEENKNNLKFYSKLSPREKEVLPLILEGKVNKEIAEKLFIEISTVKKHVERILNKTGMSNRSELISKGNKQLD